MLCNITDRAVKDETMHIRIAIVLLAVFSTMLARRADAQSFGVELHNTMMPASGVMGGASNARPQDVQSAIAGNPATLAQFIRIGTIQRYSDRFTTTNGSFSWERNTV